MKKQLEDMTLEELWQLFPIVLSEHKACWKDWYEEEEKRIRSFLGSEGVQIHHIGSTAIEGIWAKPIVDLLMEIPENLSMETVKGVLTENGYRCMWEGKNRKSFNRGYTENGFAEKVFHLHLRYPGDHDELYFRDYLKSHPDVAGEYERRKLSLWKKYEYNRDGYTEAKTEFILYYTKKAKEKERQKT